MIWSVWTNKSEIAAAAYCNAGYWPQGQKLSGNADLLPRGRIEAVRG
jgi:hypothetical protein